MDVQVQHFIGSFPAWADLPPAERQAWNENLARVPSPPPLLAELSAANLNIENFDPRALADKVSTDPVLGGRLLAEVNSARFGLTSPITSVQRAVVHLGFNLVRSIVIGYIMENAFSSPLPVASAHVSYVRRWAAGMSVLAKQWAQSADLPDSSTASTIALFSRVGSLLLALGRQPMSDAYYLQKSEPERLYFEMGRWGVHSPLLSARTLELWGVPEPLPTLVGRLWEPFMRELDPSESNRTLCIAAAASPLIERHMAAPDSNYAAVLQRIEYSVLSDNLSSMGLLAPLTQCLGSARLQRDLASVTT